MKNIRVLNTADEITSALLKETDALFNVSIEIRNTYQQLLKIRSILVTCNYPERITSSSANNRPVSNMYTVLMYSDCDYYSKPPTKRINFSTIALLKSRLTKYLNGVS